MKRIYTNTITAALGIGISVAGLFVHEEITANLSIILCTMTGTLIVLMPTVKRDLFNSIILLSITGLIAVLYYPLNIIMATAMLTAVIMEFFSSRRMFLMIITLILSVLNSALILTKHWQWPFVLAYGFAVLFISLLINYSSRIEREKDRLNEELNYINAKKGIIDINPMLKDKHNVINNEGNAGLRIMEHISEAIKTLIEMMSNSLEPKSVVYYVYDRNEDLLYPEIGISDEELTLHKPLENKGSLLHYTVKNKSEINDNLYVGDPRELGIYTGKTLVRSILTVPVMMEGRVTGLLYIDHSEEDRFTLNDMHMLRMYASQISRLLNFAKYAQKSKSDAAYFSLMNETVHSLADTLDFGNIMNQLMKSAGHIMDVEALYAVRCNEREGHILFDSSGNKDESAFKTDNTFISIVYNQKMPVIKSSLAERQVKLKIIGGRKTGSVRTAIGIPLYFFDTGEMDMAILISGSDMEMNPMKENFISFLGDVLMTAVEKSRYYEKMRDMAVKDGLTGVFNHRYFQEQLNMFIEQSSRSGRKLALIIADIDHFKSFNDRYGHQTGDLVLKHFSSLLSNHIRKSDFIARYGGEEFVIILNNIDEGIFETVDKLRILVESQRILNPQNREELSVTASFGAAVFPDNAENKDDLIKQADNALYRAKENGRNQTIIA